MLMSLSEIRWRCAGCENPGACARFLHGQPSLTSMQHCKRPRSPVRRNPGPRCSALFSGRVDLLLADTETVHQVNLSLFAFHEDFDHVSGRTLTLTWPRY